MKTLGEKNYKLFHKCVSVLTKTFHLALKDMNHDNLHAIFERADTGHKYALKTILNSDNDSIETYLAIANAYTHESLNKIKRIDDLKKAIKHSDKLYHLSKQAEVIDKVMSHVKKKD
jgi:hypothetical protein